MSDELTDEEIKTFYESGWLKEADDKAKEWARHCWSIFQPVLATRLATARNDALEEAAKWHGEQAEVAEELGIKKIASFHRDAALEIRALKSEMKP